MTRVERLEVLGDGTKIAALIREKDGTLSAVRWRVADIINRADASMTSNVR